MDFSRGPSLKTGMVRDDCYANTPTTAIIESQKEYGYEKI